MNDNDDKQEKYGKYCPQCMGEWSKTQSPFSLNVWYHCEKCNANAETILERMDKSDIDVDSILPF